MQSSSPKTGKVANRVYIRSIVHRWKHEITKASTPILVFSPYLTSKTAEDVLFLAQDRSHCEVHTHFLCEEFVRRSSSIRTLFRLTNEGIELYELPNLHGKIIVVKGVFATIGSQNLTAGGTRRQEGTYATTDLREVHHIWEEALAWCEKRRRITPEMIVDMEREVARLRREFRAFQQRWDEANRRVSEAEAQRQEEREQKAAEERRQAAEEQNLRKRAAETLHRVQAETTESWNRERNKS